MAQSPLVQRAGPTKVSGSRSTRILLTCPAIIGKARSTIANSLHTAMSDDASREAAIITFIVTASGLTLFGIGAAFWGLLAGGIASFVFGKLKP